MSNDMPVGGRLRLGVLPSIGPYLLPQAIKQVHQIRPGLRIVVREENTLDLEQGLKSGRFDLILSTPEDHPNTVQHRLFNEPLWVAVAVDDVLARDFAGCQCHRSSEPDFFSPWIKATACRASSYALAAECGGVVSDEYEGTTLDSIVLMAASGVGVAVLPDLYARRTGDLPRRGAVAPTLHCQCKSRYRPFGTQFRNPAAGSECADRQPALFRPVHGAVCDRSIKKKAPHFYMRAKGWVLQGENYQSIGPFSWKESTRKSMKARTLGCVKTAGRVDRVNALNFVGQGWHGIDNQPCLQGFLRKDSWADTRYPNRKPPRSTGIGHRSRSTIRPFEPDAFSPDGAVSFQDIAPRTGWNNAAACVRSGRRSSVGGRIFRHNWARRPCV